jgi:hypothetical protein
MFYVEKSSSYSAVYNYNIKYQTFSTIFCSDLLYNIHIGIPCWVSFIIQTCHITSYHFNFNIKFFVCLLKRPEGILFFNLLLSFSSVASYFEWFYKNKRKKLKKVLVCNRVTSAHFWRGDQYLSIKHFTIQFVPLNYELATYCL